MVNVVAPYKFPQDDTSSEQYNGLIGIQELKITDLWKNGCDSPASMCTLAAIYKSKIMSGGHCCTTSTYQQASYPLLLAKTLISKSPRAETRSFIYIFTAQREE